jgi:hypothetical protein
MRAALEWTIALLVCFGYGAWAAAQNLGAFQ